MKTRMIFIISLLLFSLLACTKKEPETLDLGTFENGIYCNQYFGFTLDLSDEWQMQENQTIQMMRKMGKEILSGDDKNMKAALDLSDMTTVNLLLATKHALGAAVAFNPNIASVAEKLDTTADTPSRTEYLMNVRKYMEMSRIQTEIADSIDTVNLGGVDFDVMYVRMTHQDKTLSQKYIVTIMKGYALSFILSYASEEENQALDNLMATLEFDH